MTRTGDSAKVEETKPRTVVRVLKVFVTPFFGYWGDSLFVLGWGLIYLSILWPICTINNPLCGFAGLLFILSGIAAFVQRNVVWGVFNVVGWVLSNMFMTA